MFDSTKELLDKIRLGEDSFLELKEVRFAGERVNAPHRDSVADELAAFANARGGVFVLGVDDASREIIGIPVERLDTVERFVFEVCAQAIDPPLAPGIERVWRSIPGAKGGSIACAQTSNTNRSTVSRRSTGIPMISRDASSTPSTNTPPRALAKAANSSATESRWGALTRSPAKRTSLSSRKESSPRRILSSSSFVLSNIGHLPTQTTVAALKRFAPAFHDPADFLAHCLFLQ